MGSQLQERTESDRPIDVAALLDRCVGDAEFVQLMLEKFRSTSVTMLNTISQAVDAGDAKQMGWYAHNIKGAAANLSAESVRSIAGRLEELGHRGEMEQAEEILSELKREMERCVAYIPTVNAQMQKESGKTDSES
jgi:ammonium transporter, Amt family